jgi:hypothetical protein
MAERTLAETFLNPYAVEVRYGLVDPTGLDRPEIAQWLDDVVAWCRAAIGPRLEPKQP